MNRIIEMRKDGQTIRQIAARLNAEGYRTPRSRKGYTSTSVRKLLSRGELTRGRIATRQLSRHEWWLPNLARELCASGEVHLETNAASRDDFPTGHEESGQEITSCRDPIPSIFAGTPSATISAGAG
jgi:hypothetical protein